MPTSQQPQSPYGASYPTSDQMPAQAHGTKAEQSHLENRGGLPSSLGGLVVSRDLGNLCACKDLLLFPRLCESRTQLSWAAMVHQL